MDRGAWLATVHGVTKSQTRLSDFTITITITITYFMRMTLGCFRGPLRQPKELLNHLGSLDMLGYMGNIVEGMINRLRSYNMVDLLIYIYIYILKLCGIRIDLICPDKNVINYNSSYHISVTYHSNGQATLSIAI